MVGAQDHWSSNHQLQQNQLKDLQERQVCWPHPLLGILIVNMSDGAQKPGFLLEVPRYISLLDLLKESTTH